MASPSEGPHIHTAICSRDGSGGVRRGEELKLAEAIGRRQESGDVVVCGNDPFANARLAFAVESAAGACKPDGPHADVAGIMALPHFQQKVPPPAGHTFYETPKRKALR